MWGLLDRLLVFLAEISLETTEEEARPSLVTPEERLVMAKLKQVEELDFDQLVPHTTPRAVVSRFFNICLELASSGILRMEQKEPYGQILIKPGRRSLYSYRM
ncbi:hypothetical protein L345_10930, partial [Ophiophagus hannah]